MLVPLTSLDRTANCPSWLDQRSRNRSFPNLVTVFNEWHTRKFSFESSCRKWLAKGKLARIEHVLIVKVYFERRQIAKVFVTNVQDSFRKSRSTATFERKLSSVSLPLEERNQLWHWQSTSTCICCQLQRLNRDADFDNKGRKVCCKVSLYYKNCQRQSCSAINCLSSGINILAGDDPFPLKSCLQVTCPLLSMVSYERCQNS